MKDGALSILTSLLELPAGPVLQEENWTLSQGSPTMVLQLKALILVTCQRCQRTARGGSPGKGKQPWAQVLVLALTGQMSLVVSLSVFLSLRVNGDAQLQVHPIVQG